MTEKVRLLNQGKRDIVHKYGVMRPGQLVAFPAEEAARLRKLLPDELMDIESATAVFAGDESDQTVIDAVDEQDASFEAGIQGNTSDPLASNATSQPAPASTDGESDSETAEEKAAREEAELQAMIAQEEKDKAAGTTGATTETQKGGFFGKNK